MQVFELDHDEMIAKRVVFRLDYGEILYRRYLDGGKTKALSRPVRRNNDHLVEILSESGWQLSRELRDAALSLMLHAETFGLEWDAWDRAHDLDEHQEFSYPTSVGFPNGAVDTFRAIAA